MSPRGAPDYSNVRAYGPLTRLDDMSEIAARLGSPVTFHRGGSVIHLNTFEKGMPGWIEWPGETGSAFSSSAEQARSAPFSMKLTPGTNSPYRVRVYKDFAYPHPGNIAVEFSFTVDYRTDNVEMELLIHDPVDFHVAAIQYNHAANTLYYLKSTGFYEVLQEDIQLSHLPNVFHTLKLVVDFEKGTYKHVWLDAYSYMNLDYPTQSFENADPPFLRVMLKNYAIDDSQPYIFVDDVIVTQNES